MAHGMLDLPADELDALFARREARVAVVGFGYIGVVIGAVLADRGWQVTGIDVRPEVVGEITRGTTRVREPGLDDLVARNVGAGRLTATTDFAAVAQQDVVIVTVGTPLGQDYEPVVDDIEAAAKGVAAFLTRGQLVVLKSTVPPNTTTGLVQPILETSGLRAGVDFGLAFCPERLAEGRAVRDLTSIPVVVGGVDARSADVCQRLWREALGVESVVVDSPREAELTKLADNLWIDLNIALANELAKICDKLGSNVTQVIDAANTLPKVNYNVNILMPSMGVGGYCLTKDPWFVHHLGEQLGLDMLTPQTSRAVNDTMPAYTCELLREQLALGGKELKDSRVAVLGIAFKNNTGDCRLTPTRDVVRMLEESGCTLLVHDPWVGPEEALTVTTVPLTATLDDTIRDADAVVYLTGHQQFRDYPMTRVAELTAQDCVVLDGRNAFQRSDVESAGLRYKGIGR
ncbi:UDP-N-acetyl-D-mannosaminuronic acid dehydrogenase [Phycicoccus badiiscoriae]|uniref:UDP-N-acetyl-D-mannosaminuronic acid dehydrogenase n=1 Tax=Pedococcus badiiscoriae TaxID=642776 RepID=A0A852WKT8_9MICO|nr:UDP-N-acetyl-D-mannosaminuronic acid dehydrogenase [Pedococcus badiiscoriae]